MILLYSHRGNTEGPKPEMENSPVYVKEALEKGYHVEIDVWKINNNIYLGHDNPEYQIDIMFLKSDPNIICHAKNVEALIYLLNNNIHCFGHNKDDYVLTSRGFIWTYPDKELTINSICVLPELTDSGLIGCKNLNCIGICSDYVERIKEILI